jgi:hypothetical protein
VDRRGQVTVLSAPERSYERMLRLSPDRLRLATTERTLTAVGLRIFDLARPAPLLRVTTEGEALWPVWGLGGQDLVFAWLNNGREALAVQPADRPAAPRALVSGLVWPSSVAADGRILALVARIPGDLFWDIVTVTVEKENARVEPVTQTPNASELWPEFSPDGRWLLYGSNVSGRIEVYVQPYPGAAGAVPVSVDGGENPAWNPNGREILFVSLPGPTGQRRMMAAQFTPGSPKPIGLPRELFSFDEGDLGMIDYPIRPYDVAVNGQRFYTVHRVTTPPPPKVTHINLILNWFEELKAKVPAGGAK